METYRPAKVVSVDCILLHGATVLLGLVASEEHIGQVGREVVDIELLIVLYIRIASS